MTPTSRGIMHLTDLTSEASAAVAAEAGTHLVIDITPEMIAAGLAALRAEPFIDLSLSASEDLVRDIFTRIWKARG